MRIAEEHLVMAGRSSGEADVLEQVRGLRIRAEGLASMPVAVNKVVSV